MPHENAVSNAIGYAKFYSRSHDDVIRVYDEAGNVIEDARPTRASSKSRSAERNKKPPRGET
jgi:hypothetical protein